MNRKYDYSDFALEKDRIVLAKLLGQSVDLSNLREMYRQVVYHDNYLYDPAWTDEIFWNKCIEYQNYLLSHSK